MYTLTLEYSPILRFIDGLISDAFGSKASDDSAADVAEAKEELSEAKENGEDTSDAIEHLVEAQEEHLADVIKETAQGDKIED